MLSLAHELFATAHNKQFRMLRPRLPFTGRLKEEARGRLRPHSLATQTGSIHTYGIQTGGRGHAGRDEPWDV